MEISLDRLERQVLLALFLLLRRILIQLFKIYVAQGVENLENVGKVVLDNLAFLLRELRVGGIEPVNVLLRFDESLNLLDETTAAHVVDEIKHHQGDPKPKLNLFDELILGQEGPVFFSLVNVICLVDEVAEKRFFLVLGLELLLTMRAHILQLVSKVSLVALVGGLWLIFGNGDLLGLLGLLVSPDYLLEGILISGPELVVQVHWVDRGLTVGRCCSIYRRSLKQS